MANGKRNGRKSKKETETKKVKIIQETIEKEKRTHLVFYMEHLTKIDEKIYAKEGIRLIDVIKDKCPSIALKLVEIVLSLSNK